MSTELQSIEKRTAGPWGRVITILLGCLLFLCVPWIVTGARVWLYRRPMGPLRQQLLKPLVAPAGATIIEQQLIADDRYPYVGESGGRRFGMNWGCNVLLDTQKLSANECADYYAQQFAAMGYAWGARSGTGILIGNDQGIAPTGPHYIEYRMIQPASLQVFYEYTNPDNPVLPGSIRPPAGHEYIRLTLLFYARGFTDDGGTP